MITILSLEYSRVLLLVLRDSIIWASKTLNKVVWMCDNENDEKTSFL